jgi:hypothetical protein
MIPIRMGGGGCVVCDVPMRRVFAGSLRRPGPDAQSLHSVEVGKLSETRHL